jgi:archaemetzincin
MLTKLQKSNIMNYTILALVLILVFSCNNKMEELKIIQADKMHQKSQLSIDTTTLSLKCIEQFHKRITLKDYDASLISYINSNPNKPTKTKNIIYIQPFGNINKNVDKMIKEEIKYLETFFQLKVKILPHISFDTIKNRNTVKTRMVQEYSYYSKMKGGSTNLQEQIEGNSFIENFIVHNKPKDAVAIIGITEHDLYLPSLNFIYGISNLKNGAGLVSTFRIVDYTSEVAKDNYRKAVSKQIVNIFSIPNVKDYKCVNNFHNNIEELYLGEFELSPKAQEKLKYTIGYDYKKRWAELKKIWEKEGNKKMSDYYTNCLKSCQVK